MTSEVEKEVMEPEEESNARQGEEKKPALTVVIHSWATPVVGIIMLVAGFLGGYFGRPLFSSEVTPMVVQGSNASDSGSVPLAEPTPDATQAAQQEDLMAAVVERTRHFRGDPAAPVTLIEFSDFQ